MSNNTETELRTYRYKKPLKRLNKIAGKSVPTDKIGLSHGVIKFLKNNEMLLKKGKMYLVDKKVKDLDVGALARGASSVYEELRRPKGEFLANTFAKKPVTQKDGQQITLESLAEMIGGLQSQMQAINMGVVESLVAAKDSKVFLNTLMSDIHAPRLEREMLELRRRS
jgi:hypothetical protein